MRWTDLEYWPELMNRPLAPSQRAAIEGYTSAIQLSNTTILEDAKVPFARYLNAIHNRIHPIFSDFLTFLTTMPKEHPLNRDLVASLEIVLDKTTGKVARMGITRRSGVDAFDAAVLAAVQRASPFGKAPDVIASPDGNVYIHWDFHRSPTDACTTYNARPFLLKKRP